MSKSLRLRQQHAHRGVQGLHGVEIKRFLQPKTGRRWRGGGALPRWISLNQKSPTTRRVADSEEGFVAVFEHPAIGQLERKVFQPQAHPLIAHLGQCLNDLAIAQTQLLRHRGLHPQIAHLHLNRGDAGGCRDGLGTKHGLVDQGYRTQLRLGSGMA